MKFEKEYFEENGLKIDKDRVLTYSQLSCPLECRYCFVEDMNFNQRKKVSYLSEEQIELIKNISKEVSIIMLGCDTEFFQSFEDSLKILSKLSNFNRDISVMTKLFLQENFISKIRSIDQRMNSHKNFISFSISLTSIDSAEKWEPNAPRPKKRIKTLKTAFQTGLKTTVALRPLLPEVSKEEIEEIIKLTKDYYYGYYSGPLYLKKLDLIKEIDPKFLKIEKMQPHWMPDGNIFYRVEREGQMENLRKILSKYEKPFFNGAAEGIKYLRKI